MASSTTQYTHQVAQAALETKIGYLDVQYSSRKILFLRSIESVILHAGCCFITDGGFHPGLPAFMVRYVAQFFDQLETARVGSVIKEDWNSLEVSESTVDELIELVNDFDMSIYKERQWRKASLISTSDYINMDFGGEFGRQYCAPMLLEEMSTFRDIPDIHATGFMSGNYSWFVDWVIMPVSMLAMKVSPHAAVSPWASDTLGLKKFSKPPTALYCRWAYGRKTASQGDASPFHPTVTCLLLSVAACMQYLDC
jgi:saccharopine dehydrogenase (NAD+, L-lysine-forming)